MFNCFIFLACGALLSVAAAGRLRLMTRLQAVTTAGGPQAIAVVGFAGGAAEVAAYKLSSLGHSVSLLLDDEPVSPVVRKNINYFCGRYLLECARRFMILCPGELDKEMDDSRGKLHAPSSLLQGKIVIVVGDSVPDEGRGFILNLRSSFSF